jgi:hypothetical protein
VRKRAELDLEAVELLRDSPDLVAIADAIVATQRPARRSRTVVRLLAAAATLIVAGVVVSVVAPWQGHGGGLVDRALAAIGDGPVLHAVIASEVPGESVVDLRTGARSPVEQRLEYWYDADRQLLRAEAWKQGSLVADIVQGPNGGQSNAGPVVGAPPGQAPVVDPALTGFVSGYRDALRSGAAREVGRGTLDGRSVIWLRIDAQGFHERLAIDAESYRPLQIEREDVGGFAPVWRVQEIETVGRDQADFSAPQPGPPTPVSGQAQAVRPLSSAQAQDVLGWTPLWLGESFAGTALQSIQLMRLTRGYGPSSGIPPELSEGLSLSYGDRTNLITIAEAAQPEPANGFLGGRTFSGSPLPQPGTADVVVAQGGNTRSCTAQLQQAGVWVTITATGSDCVKAAKALRPIGSG